MVCNFLANFLSHFALRLQGWWGQSLSQDPSSLASKFKYQEQQTGGAGPDGKFTLSRLRRGVLDVNNLLRAVDGGEEATGGEATTGSADGGCIERPLDMFSDDEEQQSSKHHRTPSKKKARSHSHSHNRMEADGKFKHRDGGFPRLKSSKPAPTQSKSLIDIEEPFGKGNKIIIAAQLPGSPDDTGLAEDKGARAVSELASGLAGSRQSSPESDSSLPSTELLDEATEENTPKTQNRGDSKKKKK